MSYTALKAELAEPDLAPNAMFRILRGISNHVNDKETHADGRDLVIRALARLELCGDFEKQILMSLVRNVGLFPYMSEWLQHAQDDDVLAYELHRPDNMAEVFHSLQAKIYYQLRAGTNVVLSASTSVGKSLLIDAMIALGKFKKIVIVVPTLALIDETRKRLARRFRDTCHLITHPTQVADQSKVNVYILTQERVRHRIDLSNIDFFVVDEFYKLDLHGSDDTARAIELNLAFHKLASTGAQFYLLGPNVQAIRGLDKYEIHFIPSEFSTVAVDLVNYDLPRRGDERNSKLIELCQSLSGPTLIYCQAPSSAARVASTLIRHVESEASAPALSSAEWVSENFHPEWIVTEALRHGIGMHHGGVPRSLQQHMVRLFNEGAIKFLVCTSTLIEGVNTAAENVIVFDRRRNKNVLDFFTYKNIQGRAGRMGRYFVGKVYVLEKPPESDEFVVDYLVGQQDQETPISLLMQLDDDALTDISRARVLEKLKESFLSEETIRLNGAVPVEIQNNIARDLQNNIDGAQEKYCWTGFPTFKQLVAVCSLIDRYLSGPMLKNYGISSPIQLAWHLNVIGRSGGIRGYLTQVAAGALAHQSVSDKIDEALRIMRNIVCFRFPQDLMVIHNIQREVFSRLEIRPGDYSVYADAVENLFLPGPLSALEEYGVPLQIVQRIAPYLGTPYDLDAVVGRLRSLDIEDLDLTAFERRLLETVKESL